MLSIENVSKYYKVKGERRTILNKINLTVSKGEKVGILGRNGAGKSTLVRLISGAEAPSEGRFVRDMSVSWPIAFAGGFQGSLSGLDNLKFICRIYGKNFREILPFIESFSEIGKYMYEPIKIYSSGMRAKLAFAISMAIEFDCYLIDEVNAVGDAVFQKKCREELFEKRKDKALIIVSHNPNFVKKHCNRILVLHEGNIYEHDTVEASYAFYDSLMSAS